MKVFVTVSGMERALDVTVLEDGRVEVRDGAGRVTVAEPARVGGGVHVLAGGQSLDLVRGPAPEGLDAVLGGVRAAVTVETERDRARARRVASAGAAKDVRAPMPGRVVKVLVAAGDDIQAGAPLCVIEAMKMENEIRSPRDGRVARVAVAPGVSVEGRAVLVVFD